MPPGLPPDGPARLEARVRGRVQGVGFRWFVVHEADALGLVGWVANEPDGRVRVVAEGPRPALERLLERLREGPPASIVESVATDWASPRGLGRGFSIRSGGHPGD